MKVTILAARNQCRLTIKECIKDWYAISSDFSSVNYAYFKDYYLKDNKVVVIKSELRYNNVNKVRNNENALNR